MKEAAEAMKEYLIEGLLSTYPDVNKIKDRREAIWNEAVETGELRLPKQADILQDGRRDLRYALQVTQILRTNFYSFR